MPFAAPWCLLAGVLILQMMPSLPPALFALAVLPVAALARRSGAARLLLIVLFGFAWAWLRAELRLSERLPQGSEGVATTLSGHVDSLVERRGDTLRFVFVTEALGGEQKSLRVRLSWYRAAAQPAPGERWRFSARLRAPRGFTNPGGFDYERWLLVNRIDATGYVATRPAPERLAAAGSHARLLRWRARLAGRLDELLPGSANLGMFEALSIGARSRIAPAQWEVLGRTGTAHLMAISGLHIGMVAGVALIVVGRLWGWLPWLGARIAPRDAGAIAALLAAGAYALLAGLSVPTQRAWLMLVCLLGTGLLRRALPPGRSLSQALGVVLLLDPFAPLSSGFWLSFVAVAAILAALHQPSPGSRAVRVQLFVWLALAPITLWSFGRVSLIAPVINLALIPVFACVVVPVLLAGVLLAQVAAPVALMALAIADSTLGLIWRGLEFAAAWQFSAFDVPGLGWFRLLLVQSAVIGVLVMRSWPWRGAGVLVALAALAWPGARPAAGSFELAVLDVGQGLAVSVRTASHTLVYDAGPRFLGGSDTGGLVVVPFLRQRGVSRLDRLIVSHADLDHRGGADSVIAAYPQAAVTGSGESRWRRCVAGRHWHWDGVSFSILYPDRHAQGAEGNDESCVLRVEGPGGSVLLPGDIERRAEHALLAAGVALESDIVVAPHHGSLTSSSPAFVRAVGARYVVFAAGHGNRWGLPRPEVAARWRAAGAHAFDTASSGAVIFDVNRDRGIVQIHEHRKMARRYWRAR